MISTPRSFRRPGARVRMTIRLRLNYCYFAAELPEATGAGFPKRTSCAIRSLPTGFA